MRIILGVDAGTTTAVAVVDVDGSVLKLESRRNWGEDALVESLAALPVPVVVACDTNPSLKLARRLKALFSARLFVPRKSLSILEKQWVAHRSGMAVRNSHERDALAAALKAWGVLGNKLRQARKKAGSEAGEQRRVVSLVLRGTRMSDAVAAR